MQEFRVKNIICPFNFSGCIGPGIKWKERNADCYGGIAKVIPVMHNMFSAFSPFHKQTLMGSCFDFCGE